MREYWEIIHYGYGMTPMRATFTDEALARRTWDDWSQDPHRGCHALQKVTVLAEVG